jgi:hypothetical protein
MGRWSVLVTGGELTDAACAALDDADITVAGRDPGHEGFMVELEAKDSAQARRQVEAALDTANGYSAGAAESAD